MSLLRAMQDEELLVVLQRDDAVHPTLQDVLKGGTPLLLKVSVGVFRVLINLKHSI